MLMLAQGLGNSPQILYMILQFYQFLFSLLEDDEIRDNTS